MVHLAAAIAAAAGLGVFAPSLPAQTPQSLSSTGLRQLNDDAARSGDDALGWRISVLALRDAADTESPSAGERFRFAWTPAGLDAGASPPLDAIPMRGRRPTRADVEAYVRDLPARLNAPGVAVIVRRVAGGDVVRVYAGGYRPDSEAPIASAAKWHTGALLQILDDEGLVDLDAPIGRCVADVPADKAAITVRQTLAHTSGLPALSPFAEAERKDLEDSARHVLALPLKGPPGREIRYSGTAMQVAAHCAEAASGQAWADLFQTRIAEPLGLRATRYQALGPGGAGPPVSGGGMWSTPQDLERFTQMLAQRGRFQGRLVMSREAVLEFSRLASGGASKVDLPRSARQFAGTATGAWCERADARGRCVAIGSAGAFGTYAWVDWEAGLYGVMVTRARIDEAMAHWRAIRDVLPKLSAARSRRNED